MTTIATDGRSIAADGRTTGGHEILSERTIKLIALPDGSAIGGAGNADEWPAVVEVLSAALGAGVEPPKTKGEYSLLRLMPNGTVLYYYESLVPTVIDAPASIGSGGKFARAFMIAGLSPADAVRATKKLDSGTGGRVRSITVRP